MYTWTTFQKAISSLKSIENSYHEYEAIQSQATLYKGILPIEHLKYQRLADKLKGKILVEVAAVKSTVYFWHFPFYSGDFVALGKALSLAGMPIEMSKTSTARDRFRQFMRSAPESAQKNISESMSSSQRDALSTSLLRKLAVRRQALAKSVLNN